MKIKAHFARFYFVFCLTCITFAQNFNPREDGLRLGIDLTKLGFARQKYKE